MSLGSQIMVRICSMTIFRNNSFKSILLLFGSTAIGYNVAAVLHELGHAIAMWVTGGQVERITLNPFSWSYTYYASTPTHPIFTSLAGVILGTVFAVLLLVMAGLLRNQYLLLLLVITNVVAGAQNGLYTLVDSLVLGGGDATNLIELGVSKFVMIGIGTLLVGSSILLAILTLRFVSFQPNDSLSKRVLILETGVLPYLMGIVVYQAICNTEEIGLFSGYAFAGAVLILVIAVLSHISLGHRYNVLDSIGWGRTWMTVVAGIAIIVVELLMLK